MSCRSSLLTALVVLATALGACDGPGVVAPGRPPVIARTGVSNLATSLVATWRRTIFFIDEFGISRSSETTWQFGADGAVTRTIVTRNFDAGLTDVQSAAGTWRVQGIDVIIDFVTPAPAQLRLGFQVIGDQLTLGSETYLRLTP